MNEEQHSVVEPTATSRGERFRELAAKWDMKADEVPDRAARKQFRRLADLYTHLSLVLDENGL
jgi:hypothetical protein